MTVKKAKVTLSKYAGFCDGVQRAFEMVEKAAKDPKVKKPIFVLDSLVHNEEVIKKIKALGIGKIDFPENIELFFKKLNKNQIGTIVITAHGVGPKIYDLAKKKGIDIIDTTCPKVIKVQRLAKFFSEKGGQVVVVGDKNHKEVKGIFEWSGNKAKIVESEKEALKLKLNSQKKISVISQTTQDEDLFLKIAFEIRKKYLKAETINTLCYSTKKRQNEIKKIAKNNDVILIVGSSQSANTTHLWKIAKKINPKSYFVERINDLKKIRLKNCKKIAISAGASTPRWIIDDVLKFIKV